MIWIIYLLKLFWTFSSTSPPQQKNSAEIESIWSNWMAFSIKNFWIFQQQNSFFHWICLLFKSVKLFTQQSLTQHSNFSLKWKWHRSSMINAKTFTVTQIKSKKKFQKVLRADDQKIISKFLKKKRRTMKCKKKLIQSVLQKTYKNNLKKIIDNV